MRVLTCGVCRTDLHLAEGDLQPRHAGMTPGHEVVGEVVETGPAVWGWQVAVAVAAIGLGWSVARATFHWVKPSERWKFGEGDFERVAFPVLAWVFVLIGRTALAPRQPVALLDILATALIAWIVIRLAVYVLGHVLPKGEFLRKVLRLVAWVAWIAVILAVTGLLPEVIGALDGIGVAISDRKFIARELKQRRLVTPFDIDMPSGGAFYFVYPEGRADDRRIATFRDWVLAELAREPHARERQSIGRVVAVLPKRILADHLAL